MTMFVLIVEDDPQFVDELKRVLGELPSPALVQVAGSRDMAFRRLEEEFYDLTILDLRIPTVDGAVDAAPEHGHAVFALAQIISPGTPLLVLTGSPAEDFIETMLKRARQVDIWGEGRTVGTIDFLRKLKFEEFPARLAPISAAVQALSTVELDRGGVNLTPQEDRLIRIFSRRFQGARCAVSRLSGGLSGAKVLRLRVTNSFGVPIHDAVAKLGSPDQIKDEAARFEIHVSRLDPNATPRRLAVLKFGAGAVAGIFYGLADGYESSAFDVALHQNEHPVKAVMSIESAVSRWTSGVPETRRPISEIRRRLVSDVDLERFQVDWKRSSP
jgi:CheY-like chemotaxis protein